MSRKHRHKIRGQKSSATVEQPKLHGVKGFRGPELVIMTCPQCSKRRMYRSAGHTISQFKQLSKDKERQRYIDVCEACLKRYAEEDRRFEQRAKIAEKALEEGKDVGGDVSLEDAL